MKKILSLFTAATLALGSALGASAAKKVHTIGDSTITPP